MRALLWIFAAIGLALWSLLGWIGFALIGVASAWLVGVPGVDLLVPLAQGAAFVVWVLGALAIVAAPIVIRKVARLAGDAMRSGGGYAVSAYGRRSIAQRLAERLIGRYGRRLGYLARR